MNDIINLLGLEDETIKIIDGSKKYCTITIALPVAAVCIHAASK